MKSGEPKANDEQPRQALSLWDSTSIIVGIIIGSAIYQIPPTVAATAGGWAVGLLQGSTSDVGSSTDFAASAAIAGIIGVWLIGGLVALIGAMCYAELATAYPEAGGTYVYLSAAFGRSVGFAFAWAEFWIVRPGNIGVVAFVLAQYGQRLLPAGVQTLPGLSVGLAAGSIVVLAFLNALGLEAGKRTQNLLTILKIAGLGAIILTALSISPPSEVPAPSPATANLSLALINIMFAYGGWADISFVAAEVRRPERNIFRALALGTGVVAAIYVAINIAFLSALGVGGVAQSKAVAADILALRFGGAGSRAISLLVVISCLGALNGMLFTGARVFYALGAHHPAFRWLGTWNAERGVPLRSLILQTLITLGLVIGFGWRPEGFERLVVFTAPFYWDFIGLVGIALIVLRARRATARATYQVPFFPLPPLIFAATSGAMVYAAIAWAIQNFSQEAWWAGGVILAGLIFGGLDWWQRR